MLTTEIQNNFKEVFEMTWEQQIEYVMYIESVNLQQFNMLKNYYENIHKRSFKFDILRFTYGYLRNMTTFQAVTLYDVLPDHIKYEMIDVIKYEYPHLNDVVDIHDMLVDTNEVFNIELSVFTSETKC